MRRLASVFGTICILWLFQPQTALAKVPGSSASRLARSSSAASGNPTGPYVAVVNEAAATFTFPYPQSRRFEWCPGGLQYGFEVATPQYQFGFTLFTAMGASPCGEGNLQEMLNAGQTDAFRLQRDGGGESVPGSDTSISIRADAQRRSLVVSVSGAPMVRRLLSGHPATVEFTMTTPAGEVKRRVPVQYVR